MVDEAFVLRVSNKLNLAGAAPLLCAGVTTYSPLRHWQVGKGQKVGVVGLGGLGHMGVKFASAFGAHVVLFTTSPNKTADAQRLGAHEVVVSKNQGGGAKAYKDFRLHSGHGFGRARFERLPRAAETGRNPNFDWRAGTTATRSRLRSSFQAAPACRVSIGGTRETQEMLDFCAEHAITANVEPIRIEQINEAYERLLKSDVKYRFVIDMASLK